MFYPDGYVPLTDLLDDVIEVSHGRCLKTAIQLCTDLKDRKELLGYAVDARAY